MKLSVDIRKDYGAFQLASSFETEDLVTGLLGASGCGKSMTLKCIAGIETPDEGTIVLDGRVLFDSQRHINVRPQDRHVGYLFQSYALFPTMNVRRNILAGMHGLKDKEERRRRYESAMSLLHLEGLEEHKPFQLSGGQAQRVALARIIVSQPKLLLLDEPFSALDTHLKDSLQADMKRLLEQLGKQAVMVTHSVSEAFRLCSRICVMEHGQVVRGGAPEEVFHDPQAEGCAKLFGHRNIFRFERKGETLYIPELGLELPCPAHLPQDATKISITDDAIAPSGAIMVRTEEILKESDGNNLILNPGGEKTLWYKTPLVQVDSIAIDVDRCIFLKT